MSQRMLRHLAGFVTGSCESCWSETDDRGQANSLPKLVSLLWRHWVAQRVHCKARVDATCPELPPRLSKLLHILATSRQFHAQLQLKSVSQFAVYSPRLCLSKGGGRRPSRTEFSQFTCLSSLGSEDLLTSLSLLVHLGTNYVSCSKSDLGCIRCSNDIYDLVRALPTAAGTRGASAHTLSHFHRTYQ